MIIVVNACESSLNTVCLIIITTMIMSAETLVQFICLFLSKSRIGKKDGRVSIKYDRCQFNVLFSSYDATYL
jgi:hypothetical protein